MRQSPGDADALGVPKAYHEFEAWAFHPDFGNESREGVLLLSPHSLTFRSGEMVVEFPTQHVAVELDNNNGDRIVFRHSDWTIVTFDQDVFDFRSIPQIARLADEFESHQARRELSRRAKIVLSFFVALVFAVWLGMIAVGAMVRAIVARVPPDVEQKLGKGVLEELQQDFEFLDDSNKVAHLEVIAQPLLRVVPAGQTWKFYIVDDPSPNAFAIPGGHIIVTSGLLDLADRPEQVLGVLAHELAHVTQKHSFRQQIASAGPMLVFQVFLGGRSGTLALVTGGSALLVHQSFSQEYEKEADDTGWQFLLDANVDPRGMLEMFQKFKVLESGSGGDRIIPKAFESHPDLEKRITRLERKWKRLSRKSGFLDLAKPEP